MSRRDLRATAALLAALISFCLQAEARGGRAAHARLVPDDVDVYVAFAAHEPGDRRAGGEAAWTMLKGLWRPAERAREGWTSLLARTGISEAEAAETFLSRRATLAVRRAWEDEPAWVLLVDVEPKVVGRLARALDAAPRRIVAGSPVLTFEQGAIEMAAIERGRYKTLVVAPAAPDNGLLPEALRLNRGEGAARPLVATERYAALLRLPRSPLRALVTLPKDGGWLASTARAEGRRIEATIEGVLPLDAAPPPPTSLALWDRVTDDALFAAVDYLSDDWTGLPLLDTLGNSPLAPPDDLLERFGPYAAVRVEPAGETGLALVGAVSLNDVEAAAPAADEAMSDLARGVSTMLGKGAWAREFDGLYPSALRRVRIADKAPAPLLAPGPLELCWMMPGADSDGWLVAGTDGEGVRLAASRITEARRPSDADDARRWVRLGEAKPAAIVERLRRAGSGAPRAIARLASLEWVRWRIASDREGRVTGVVEAVPAAR